LQPILVNNSSVALQKCIVGLQGAAVAFTTLQSGAPMKQQHRALLLALLTLLAPNPLAPNPLAPQPLWHVPLRAASKQTGVSLEMTLAALLRRNCGNSNVPKNSHHLHA